MKMVNKNGRVYIVGKKSELGAVASKEQISIDEAMEVLASNRVETRVVKSPDTDEYIVKVYRNGKHNPDEDYYTDDKEDAIITSRKIEGKI